MSRERAPRRCGRRPSPALLRLARSDRTAAKEALEAALDARPDHVAAARRLLKLSIEDRRWERCPPLIALELRHLPAGSPPKERAALQRLAGDVALEVGDTTAALGACERVLALLPGDVRAQYGRATALRRADRPTDARQAFVALLDSPPAELPSDLVAASHRAIDEIDQALGERGRSVEHLEKVLAERPDDAETLRTVLPVYEQRGDWDKAVAVRRRLARQSIDGLARFNHLLAMGAAQLHHLEAPEDAVRTYKEALVIQPESQAARIGLLDAQLAAGDLPSAVSTLEALIRGAETDQRKAALHHTLAVVYRDRLKDDTAAIRHFDAALDLDPERLQSFADMDALLARRNTPSGQTGAYKKMLLRLSGRGQRAVEHRLWHNLGQLYARQPGRHEDAIMALREAVERAPDALEPRRLLAKLLDERPEKRDQAIREHREFLRYRPRDIPTYKALRRHFAEMGRFDAAWCATGVLDLLDAADEREKAFYERFRTGALQVTGQPLEPSEWPDLVLVPEEERTVGELLALFLDHLGGELQGARPKEHGLTARDLVAVDAFDGPFRDLYRAVVRLLGASAPPVYRRSAGSGIRTLALQPPVVAVGEDLLTSRKGKQVRFELAKALAFHHPWHILTANLPVAALGRLLEVAVRFTLPESSDAQADEDSRRLLRHLRRRLPPGDIQHLSELGHRLKSRGPLEDTLRRWLRAIERTTNHVGLLLANDLEVAVRCVRREEWSADHMPLEDQVDDLLRYAVSDEYEKLRKRVGILIR